MNIADLKALQRLSGCSIILLSLLAGLPAVVLCGLFVEGTPGQRLFWPFFMLVAMGNGLVVLQRVSYGFPVAKAMASSTRMALGILAIAYLTASVIEQATWSVVGMAICVFAWWGFIYVVASRTRDVSNCGETHSGNP